MLGNLKQYFAKGEKHRKGDSKAKRSKDGWGWRRLKRIWKWRFWKVKPFFSKHTNDDVAPLTDQTHFHIKRLRTKTCLEKEGKGNSGMVYFLVNFNCRFLFSLTFSVNTTFVFKILERCRSSFKPRSQPIKSKTEANRDLLAHSFPRFTSDTCIYFVFWWVRWIGCVLSDWPVIRFVLVLRHSIGNCSNLILCHLIMPLLFRPQKLQATLVQQWRRFWSNTDKELEVFFTTE